VTYIVYRTPNPNSIPVYFPFSTYTAISATATSHLTNFLGGYYQIHAYNTVAIFAKFLFIGSKIAI
jgi:hypothetical protein